MLTTASVVVNLSVELSRINGAKNSLHDVRNANSATVTRPGRTAGNRMRVKTATLLQPSTCADSSNSRGTASNELRIMKIENGSWNITSTRLSPISESSSPIAPSSTYSAIRIVAYGTIRID